MSLSYDKLSPSAVEEALSTAPGWSLDGPALVRDFSFESYKDGLVFGAAVGYVADALNHHPDLHIGYKKVRVSMVTHDAGGGLTSYDFELARRINGLLG
ncbi:MAG: 4a-hydroxytetrahydrobiopterin dehydratase [Armatimonadetes bacterium]|nr:4a-hydroxytetrahydrobiopterin dehydratase [Armatimonadota bacterium]